MKIKSIEYENFRNFRDYGTIKCSTDGKVTIIYGKNGGSVKKFVSLEENDSFLVRITI